MATEDREVMEARGAGESCPTFSKLVPGDSTSEGKPKVMLEPESLKPDSSYDYLEEMDTGEDRGCPGPPKSDPTTKGQAGDAPEPTELSPAPGTEHPASLELERLRMDFELVRLKHLHEENERQRQHEAVMAQLQQQRAPRQFSGSLQDLLLPQNQFAMFLFCFIFVHIIYVTKEMVFFLFSRHYLFCIATILLCLIKTLWSYFQVAPNSFSALQMSAGPGQVPPGSAPGRQRLQPKDRTCLGLRGASGRSVAPTAAAGCSGVLSLGVGVRGVPGGERRSLRRAGKSSRGPRSPSVTCRVGVLQRPLRLSYRGPPEL
ncbi:transmembrane protein 247 [Cavia porcellus]|uniref:transmembrane protein 247 n=1 Tax=Cavia porcellus TaxID=10141 RepID=UPI002FE0BAF5